MTDWVDVCLYAVFLTIVWYGLPAGQSRFVLPLVADRDPDWAATHPDAARHLRESRWFAKSCGVMGAISLAVLLACQLEMWPRWLSAPAFEASKWMVLRDVSAASAIVAILYAGGCYVLFARWLHQEVPLAERRHAALERRSIDDYVPRGFQLVVYSLIILHLAAWLVAAVSGRYSTSAFWATFAFQVFVSGLIFIVAHGNVRRRPNAMDRIFGPRYRRSEVRFAFVMQLFPLGNGIARLYEEVAATVVVDDANRALQLGVVVLITVMFFRFVWSHASSTGSTECAESAS